MRTIQLFIKRHITQRRGMMKIIRRIIRKKLCHPIVLTGVFLITAYMTSNKWVPYISDRLYNEGSAAREIYSGQTSNETASSGKSVI